MPADETENLGIWLAGEYAAVDNKLYGMLLNRPELCEKICSAKEPKTSAKARKKSTVKVENLHDLTLRAILTLRNEANSYLDEGGFSKENETQKREGTFPGAEYF